MIEREYVEHVAWDTASIIDAAIDTSIEVLRTEGVIRVETTISIGQKFAFLRHNPCSNLNIIAPDGETSLITFVPPLEYAVNKYDLDEGELPGEAHLVVYNPLSGTDEPEYRKIEMELILNTRLADVSDAFRLRRNNLVVAFPREYYGREITYYNVPILR